jgi:type I restriction enzyme R subunit
LYIDKPMKAHTLMQAIARANRVYPCKACGVIVDYNGMLKSLRAAPAQYATGDEGDTPEESEFVEPIEQLVASLAEALDATEGHFGSLGFDARWLDAAKGFERTEALRDAVDAVYSSDESKRRYEIMAREVFARFKALLTEPSARAYVVRRDNIEAI